MKDRIIGPPFTEKDLWDERDMLLEALRTLQQAVAADDLLSTTKALFQAEIAIRKADGM